MKFVLLSLGLYLLAFGVLVKTHLRSRPLIYRTSDYYKWKGGSSYATFREWDPERQWDVVVIGSSHAYRGYDPSVFAERGFAAYNLGSTAQTPLSSYAVLKYHVNRNNARLVIIDLYENRMDQDGLESVSDLSQNLTSDMAALALNADLRDLRGINLFTLRMLDRCAPAMYQDPNYKGSGFSVRPDSVRKPLRYDTGRPLKMNERQVQRLVDCIDLCEQRGIPVVLSTHFYPHQSDRGRHAAFAHAVDSLIRGRGIPYFDLAYQHSLSDRDHFCDNNHLNEAGARIFTERLIDSLELHGHLRRP